MDDEVDNGDQRVGIVLSVDDALRIMAELTIQAREMLLGRRIDADHA